MLKGDTSSPSSLYPSTVFYTVETEKHQTPATRTWEATTKRKRSRKATRNNTNQREGSIVSTLRIARLFRDQHIALHPANRIPTTLGRW